MVDTTSNQQGRRGGSPPGRGWREYATPRNAVGALLLLILLVASGTFVRTLRNPVNTIDCDAVQTSGFRESGEILSAQLRSDIAELERQQEAVVEEIELKQAEVQSIFTRAAELRPGAATTTTTGPETTEAEPETTEAEPETTDAEPETTTTGPETTTTEPETTEAEPETTEATTTTTPETRAAVEAADEEADEDILSAAEQQAAVIEAEIGQLLQDLDDLQAELTSKHDALSQAVAVVEANPPTTDVSTAPDQPSATTASTASTDPSPDPSTVATPPTTTAITAADGDAESSAADDDPDAALATTAGNDGATSPTTTGDGVYSPPPAAVSLQPRSPVAVVNLGSDRNERRAQIVLEVVAAASSSENSAEQGASQTASSGEVAQLPAKPTFTVGASQFRRTNGAELPADNVQVWARRVGQVVFLDVCIDPDRDLDAGRYRGDVYLVDPSMNPVRVPVEVTAQSKVINWLYGLLMISPMIAFFYIWVTGRISAGENPWDRGALKKWAGQNFMLCFAVGFAAVWATLQVPFNDPTWGSSVLGSTAVVGVGLVASVTAMTAVAGPIRDARPQRGLPPPRPASTAPGPPPPP